MKKITYLFVLISSFAFAQNPTNYLEISNDNIEVNTDNSVAVITRGENNQRVIIDTYTTLGDFNTAVVANCSDVTLTSEDFSNGPAGITVCGPTISDVGDGCFVAGEIESGFSVEASNGTDTVNIPPGAIGNADSLVGAAAFAEYTIISFSQDVYAVAMDIWENNDPTTTVRIFGAGGVLIESIDVTTPINSQTFFGVVADELITAIELEGANGSGELFGNFLFGADCLALSVEDNLQEQISIYPNPVNNTLFIRTPSSITINEVKIYDTLGKSMEVIMLNNQINLSKLNNGVYFIQINTLEGTLTKKIVKK